MSVAVPPPRPVRRFKVDTDQSVPSSPSPPISPTLSTPSDISCGVPPVVLSIKNVTDSGLTQTYEYPAKPRGGRPSVLPPREVRPAYLSAVSPEICQGPVLPRPSGPLPPVPTDQGRRPRIKLDRSESPAVGTDAPPPILTRPDPAMATGATGIRRSKRFQRRRNGSAQLHMQKINGEQDEASTEKKNVQLQLQTAVERPSNSLLSAVSDYRLSPASSHQGSPTSDERGRFTFPAPSHDSTPTSVTTDGSYKPAATSQSRKIVGFDPLPTFRIDSETLAEDEEGHDLVPPAQSNALPWSTTGRTWNDKHFISPLERLQAVQLDASRRASLPTSPDYDHCQLSPGEYEEPQSIASFLPEANVSSPAEGRKIFSHDGYRLSTLGLSRAFATETEMSAGAESFSHRSFGCHLDDEERMEMAAEAGNMPPVTPVAGRSGSEIARVQGVASHPFFVKSIERMPSVYGMQASMKSLPATPMSPVESGPGTHIRGSPDSINSSIALSEGAQSQKLRWTKSLASVFRKAQADGKSDPLSETDEIPDMRNLSPSTLQRASTMSASSRMSKMSRSERKKSLRAARNAFSVSRPPTRRQLFEAGTCFVRDEDGNEVSVADFFPPDPSDSEDADAVVRPGSSASAHTTPKIAPPPRTILFFLRNFWCGMCQDYTLMSLSRLDPKVLAANNIRVVVIGCGDYKMIKPYKKLFNLQFECYTDGPRHLYELMGMVKGAAILQPVRNRATYNRPYIQQVFNGVKNGIGHMGGPLADPGYWRQLGGEFVLAPGYKCQFAHRMTNMANHMEALDVLAAVGVDASREGEPSPVLRTEEEMMEALNALALHGGSSVCFLPDPNPAWSKPESMDDTAIRSKRSFKQGFWDEPAVPPRSASALESSAAKMERQNQFSANVPDLVRPGSGSSSGSEGPFTDSGRGTLDDLDPIEMHRCYYSSLFVDEDEPQMATPVLDQSNPLKDVGTVITVDAEGRRVSGRKAVVMPSA